MYRLGRAWRPISALGLILAAALLACAPAGATIRYEVSLANPGQHTFHVQMTIPDVRGSVTVAIPAWNALYQIRDFGQHITNFRAVDDAGHPLPAERLDKQTWRIRGNSMVHVEYASYWDEQGPFGTELNNEHAFLNLAMVLCYVPERRAEDAEVRFLNLPENWRAAAELPKDQNAAAGTSGFRAASYDEMVDAPVEISRFEEIDFQAAGKPIRVIVHGDAGDKGRLTQMLTQIIESESLMMGGPPFQEYMFLYHVGRGFGGGGMEHANCTAISMPSAAQLPNVSAHEFFHLWNVKRIRPRSLEPVDYAKEMYSPSLWFAEGVTNTYAAFTLVRTGLWSKSQFLADLTDQINELESRPAHKWESAEESSRNAWLEKYELYNQPGFSISYYNKGQLLGLGLDLLIRDATNNRASLDDVMRKLNEEYAQRGRFYPDGAGIRGAVAEVLHDEGAESKVDLDGFFARYVAGTDELPLSDWLSRAGLTLASRGQNRATLGFSMVTNGAGVAVVNDLDLSSSAARAGVREGDQVVSLDGADVSRNLARWLRGHQPGDLIHARLSRNDSASDISFALGGQNGQDFSVEEAAQADEHKRAVWNGLLTGTTTPAQPR